MSIGLAAALQRLRAERTAETVRRGWGELPPWLFCSEAGTALDLSNVTKAWRRVLKRAGLPGYRLPDLRHTFATGLLAEGVPIIYVAAQLGHTKPTPTPSGTPTGSSGRQALGRRARPIGHRGA
jgi:integrase